MIYGKIKENVFQEIQIIFFEITLVQNSKYKLIKTVKYVFLRI